MKFIVDEKVFEQLEDVCFGVVIAREINNRDYNEQTYQLLDDSIAAVTGKFAVAKVKESAEMAPYRQAFVKLGMNPNKFMSSVEAMASRIEKKKGFPHINPAVDLGNAISLRYLVPMGAHDIDSAAGDIQVRFSQQGDNFVPFGETTAEILDSGELIYSVGDKVKTRRWIWRQSEHGKITEETKNIFFPIDGFAANKQSVLAARQDLAELLQKIFACDVQIGWVDKNNRIMEF